MGSDNTNTSAILNLQVLENEYNLVMKQYEQAHANYISSLQSDANSSSKSKFVTLKNRAFWGEAGLKEGVYDSIEKCKALCSADALCTGATYNTEKSYCWTRSGKGEVTVGGTGDIAIITDVAQNTYLIQSLNEKLTTLNQKIETALTSVEPQYASEIKEKNQKQMTLQKTHKQLLLDRANIERLIKEYNTLEQDYIDTTIFVEQSNTYYLLWIVTVLVIFLYTIKQLFFPTIESNPIKFIFWFIIAGVFTIVTTHLNTAPGFFLWGVIIVFVCFIQMKILPSP
jgi:hypothetical protein